MSEKLYLHNTYLFASPASIRDKAEDEKGEYILLDQTIFYPQGGGQPSDQGIIKGIDFETEILQVRQVEDEVRHYLTGNPHELAIDAKVTCLINQEKRLLHARYHTAAHLIGNVVEQVSPMLTAVKGHAFPNEAYVEFQGTEIPDVASINNVLQQDIQNAVTVKTFEIDRISFEDKYYKLPYFIPGNKTFRAMQIGDYLPVPCGGTHLANVKEIGSIEISKVKGKKDIVRVSYEVV